MAETITTARVRSWLETFGIDLEAHAILNGDESVDAMLTRIAESVNSGDRTLDQLINSLIIASGDGGVTGIMSLITKRGLTVNDVLLNSGIAGIENVSSAELAEWLAGQLQSGAITATDLQAALDSTEPVGAITTPVEDPVPEPEPVDVPEDETMSFEEQTRALFPYLPQELVDIYAQAWAESGSEAVAVAVMRQSDVYEKYFPGNLRDDGTVRLSESAYLSTLEGYSLDLLSYGLNPVVFEEQMILAIENGVSVAEMEARLDLAFEGLLGINMPEVAEFYSQAYGVPMTDEAIFASIIDPTISDAILNSQIAVSQVGAAGLLAGFSFGDVEGVATNLAGVGYGLQNALGFFGEAADQTPILTALARRFDTDKTFDLSEFADATVFADAFQRRRAERLVRRDVSTYSEHALATKTGALTGLVAQ